LSKINYFIFFNILLSFSTKYGNHSPNRFPVVIMGSEGENCHYNL